MFHKSKQFNCVLATPQSSVVLPVEQIISEDVEGVTVERSVFVPVDLASRRAELSLPKASEYTLENLLKAGVDLKTLNPIDYFRSSDPFDVELANDSKLVGMFKEFTKDDSSNLDVQPDKKSE